MLRARGSAGLGILFAAAILATARAPARADELRITIDRPGVYAVSAEDVKKAGLDLARCDLFTGTATAVEIVEKAGGFEFWGELLPRHSRERSYILRPRGEGEHGKHADRVVSPHEIVIEPDAFYDPLATQQGAFLGDFGGSEFDYFFFGKPESTQKYTVVLPPLEGGETAHPGKPEGGLVWTVPIVFRFQGERRASASNGVRITWDGHALGGDTPIRWTGGRPFEAKPEAQEAIFHAGKNEVAITAVDGTVRLERIVLPFGPALEAPRAPVRVEVCKPDDLLRGGADYVAIALDSLAPELAPLLAHREKGGLKTRLVRLQDIFDVFSGGTFDPAAIRDFLQCAVAGWDPKPRYVLLCGPATYDVDWLRPRGETMPTGLVDTFENGATASDDWFVAWAPDHAAPALAIGRFPARTKEECRSMVERTIRYETQAETGPWRRKISFVAGEGRFGEAIDKAIEEVFLKIADQYIPYDFDANMTYASAASPYLFIPEKLSEKVVDRLNEGCILLSYTGHGAREALDSLRFRGKRFPIFDAKNVAQVKCTSRPPIVFINACWTGCFDYPDEVAVGEQLFIHAQGPVAVVGASRVSHPYANAVLGKEIVAALFGAGARARTFGDALREAKRMLVEGKDEFRDMIGGYALLFVQDPALLDRLLHEEMHLYNLFGDPALVPAFPRGKITLACGRAVPGKKMKVTGTCEGMEDGKAVVSFEISRGKIRGKLEPVDLEKKDAEKKILKNYETANDKVVVRAEAEVKGGSFEVSLALPDDLLPVRHYVKAYAWTKSDDAAGSCEVKLDLDDDDEK
jgi:hypothetical protein